MEKYRGRVALVTGASSGIGREMCKFLIKSGMTVVGVSRNTQSILELKKQLASNSLFGMSCDLTKEGEIESLFKTIISLHGGVDVCINSAGMAIENSIIDGCPKEWRNMTDLNVIALCHCSQLAIQSMRDRNVDDGHIVNICSLAGHLLSTSKPIHFYTATKHAVRAITEGLRLEMRELNSNIRISCVSPGIVKTDFFRRALNGSEAKSNEILSALTPLTAKDVCESIMHILSAPPHVEINDIILRPVEQKV